MLSEITLEVFRLQPADLPLQSPWLGILLLSFEFCERTLVPIINSMIEDDQFVEGDHDM